MILGPKFPVTGLLPAAELLGRLLLAQLFIIEAFSKLGEYDAAVAYVSHYGLPAQVLPLAIAVELIGGLCLLLGWQTQITGLILAAFCLATAAIFHNDFSDRGQVIHFQKDLALAGAFLILSARGAGRLSLDAWRDRYNR